MTTRPTTPAPYCHGCGREPEHCRCPAEPSNGSELEPSARYPGLGFVHGFRTPIDDFYEWGGWDHLPKEGEGE